jgi:hypothetical protein
VQADDPAIMRRMRRQPTDLPGMLTRRQMIEHYANATGRDVGNWTFYRSWACSGSPRSPSRSTTDTTTGKPPTARSRTSGSQSPTSTGDNTALADEATRAGRNHVAAG